jgi:lipopolysaccharide heptosyltransferase II
MFKRRRRDVAFTESPEFLVIETGLIGELLVATPALRAIRKAYPKARVTVMARPASAAVLVGNPAVDRLLPLSKDERGGFFGAMRLASWIRAKKFDAAFVLHTSFRSALAAAMGAVPVRAGLTHEGRGFLLTHKAPRDLRAHRTDENLRVLGLLGIPSDGADLEMHLTDEERGEASELLRASGAGASGLPLVGLHPGAGNVNRRWPAESFAALGAKIAATGRFEPVFFFGPADQEFERTIAAHYQRADLPPPPLVSPKNVRVLGAAFERTAAVVANNSGPMHVAAAVCVPGVFVHGPTPVARWAPRGPGYANVVSADVECRPCDESDCRLERLECLEAVTPDQVLEALDELLKE